MDRMQYEKRTDNYKMGIDLPKGKDRTADRELEGLCKRCIAHVAFDWEKEKYRLIWYKKS